MSYILCIKKSKRIWEIKDSKVKIGEKICDSLLAIHSISGCDTTSRIHSISKISVLKKCLNDDGLLTKMNEFTKAKTKTEVVNIGLLILLKLLGAKKEMCLDELRSRKYIDKITRSSKNAVKPESLGPTKDATELPLLRC